MGGKGYWIRMLRSIREDVQTVFIKDPAAGSAWEVVLCYPGLHAVWLHRVAHWLWERALRLVGRLLSQLSRSLTGIEIHPGARIGRRVFIDHGNGVVIGETAEVGDDVLMYQGVVLGGTSLEKRKRHPTIEDHAVLGTGAILLGPITIGSRAKVGAGSVVVKSVRADTTVVGVPARVAGEIQRNGRSGDLDHGQLPDPVLRVINDSLDRQDKLEERVRDLERALLQVSSLSSALRHAELEAWEDLGERIRRAVDPI
jgi:serine O-acetyltransferase